MPLVRQTQYPFFFGCSCQENYFFFLQYHAQLIDTLRTANPQNAAAFSLGTVNFSAAPAGISFCRLRVSTYQIENPAPVPMIRTGEMNKKDGRCTARRTSRNC